MSISAAAANPIAYRIAPPPPSTLKGAAPSSPQQTGRMHHGSRGAPAISTASSASQAAASTANGSLLDTLV